MEGVRRSWFLIHACGGVVARFGAHDVFRFFFEMSGLQNFLMAKPYLASKAEILGIVCNAFRQSFGVNTNADVAQRS